MKRGSVIKMLFPWFMLLAVTSCGTTTDYAGGGIGGTGISVGKITEFGSVWVNGIEFDTTGAKIIKDGVSVLEVVTDDKDEPPIYLRRGMIVIVRGEFSPDGMTGKASSIEFSDNLEGPITAGSIDMYNQTFEVLGQTVKVDVDTVFDEIIGFAGLRDGNIVEVSGFVDATGIIHASYISLKSETFEGHGAEIELKGIITHNPDTGKFTIGSLTIDFLSEGLETAARNAADNGLFVEVKSSAGVIDGVLIATEIDIEEKGHHVEAGHEFEVEGYVTVESVLTDGMFKLEGQSVQITSNTIFESGASIADIVVDVKLEVEGTVDAFGVLVADKIEIESGDDGNDDSEDGSSDDSDNDAGDDAP